MTIEDDLRGIVAGHDSASRLIRKTVSVVICVSEASELARLKRAVVSVLRQETQAHELLLVVDGSPGLVEAVSAAIPGARVIPNARGSGLSGSRNTGVLAATGDIVAFLDDDVAAAPNWLWEVATRFSSPFVVGVGGEVAPHWPSERPMWLPSGFDWFLGCSSDGRVEDNFIGGNMSFRRSALTMAGLFAEGAQGSDAIRAGEAALCIRVVAMFPGARLVLDGDARVLRQIEERRATLRHFMWACLENGRSWALVPERRRLRGLLRVEAPLGGAQDRPVRGAVARWLAAAAGHALVLAGRLWPHTSPQVRSVPEREFVPLKVVEVDLGKRLPRISAKCPVGQVGYGAARVVVRASGRLRAVLQVPLFGEDLAADELDSIVEPFRGRSRARRKVTPGRVRVIVATRDRTASLARCLDSLLAQDHPDFEIVVVDNAPSTDETRRMLRRKYARTRKVHYVLEECPGLANAHNRGLDGMNADFVAFTDDDVVADRAWLRTLVRPFAEGAEIGCVTGGILPAELETRAQYWTEMHGGFLKGVVRRDFDLAAHRPGSPLFPYAAGMFGSGANMAFRSSVLNDIGGFDPALGAGTLARGGDDLAAFADTVLAGHRLVYNPDALVWHYHRRGADGMERQAFGYGVGLGAHLTRLVVRSPRLAFHFLLAAPIAVRKLFSRKSAKNARLPSDYPAGFVWKERYGILAGMPAYLRSRRASRRATSSKAAWKSN